MNGNNPKKYDVSVLMPVYNASKYLNEAVDSILNQSLKDFELILIDDGSTDGSWDIISQYASQDSRIVPLKNEHIGICEILNKGLAVAKGKYIARMDADDWAYPERLEKQLAFLKQNPEVVIVGASINICDSNLSVINKREYPLTNKSIRAAILKRSPYAHPAVMYKKDIALEVLGYNPDLVDSEDYDLYLRLGRKGEFANLNDILLKLRTHPESVSQRKINRQAMLTLYIKLKAVFEYKYKMGRSDKLNFVLHFLGIVLIPAKLKFRFFNYLIKKRLL